jgi:hypothetical protein
LSHRSNFKHNSERLSRTAAVEPELFKLRTDWWHAGCNTDYMTKNSLVRFRSGSRLPASLGLSAESMGTVLCKYLVSNPNIGAAERVDVSFDGDRIAWGVPSAEFVLVEQTGPKTGAFSRAA